jgi:hypothetical protein
MQIDAFFFFSDILLFLDFLQIEYRKICVFKGPITSFLKIRAMKIDE